MDNTIFEKSKYFLDDGNEFWLARELQTILAYKEWRNFNKVIETAKIACTISKQDVNLCFVEVNKPIINGTLAENLPTPDKSIQELSKEQLHKLKK